MKKVLLLLLLPTMLLAACGDDIDEPTPSQPTVQEDSKSMTVTVNGVSFKMIKVAGGTFEMGGKEGDPDAHGVDKPSHQVTLSSYYIGEMEVTQELWMAVMGGRIEAAYYKLPKDGLNFEDCRQFINRLNQLTGKNFRLPTEAEWEFAARGGNKSKGYSYSGGNTLSTVAWTKDNSSGQLRNVGTKSANELGIYDMSGNAFEWCEDWLSSYTAAAQTNPKGPSTGTSRIVRGGSVSPDADHPTRLCHVYARACNNPNNGGEYFGFRLAL